MSAQRTAHRYINIGTVAFGPRNGQWVAQVPGECFGRLCCMAMGTRTLRLLASSWNEPVIKEHLRYPGCFEPTTGWDNVTAKPQGGVVGYPHFNPKGVWTTDPADR